jgi:hypothetical protein
VLLGLVVIVQLVEVCDQLVVVLDDGVNIIGRLDLLQLFLVAPNLLLQLFVHAF